MRPSRPKTLPALGLALATLTGLPALAADLLTAEEFDTYTRGKTLSYSMGGQVYGQEQYLPDRRVIWAFSGDECHRGSWYEQAGQICFVYDDSPEAKCWTFEKGAGGLLATFLGDDESTRLSEVAQSPKPLSCPGPDVGA